MRLRHGLRARILLSAAICAVVIVGPIIVLMLRYVVRTATESHLKGHLISDQERQRCEQDPRGWSIRRGEVSIFALEMRTLRSPNPSAPRLDAAFARTLKPGDPFVYRHRKGQGMVALKRIGGRAPCDVLLITITHSPAIRRAVSSAFAVGTALAVGISMLLSMALAVRPLVRRLRQLRASALQLGRPQYQALSEPIDDDIGQIAGVLDSAHRRITDDADALRRQRDLLASHLANVAHDLRTPLASLQLALEEAERTAKHGDESIDRAFNDVIYISALVENLHVGSQLRSGLTPLGDGARCDLTAITERVAKRATIVARRRRVEVDLALPDGATPTSCDPTMAERALSNLVQNAVVHGEIGGHVAIVLDQLPGGNFELTVIDDGPGIAPAELPRLLHDTYRAASERPRDSRGTGLGLAITGEICRLANWSLTLTNREEGGLRASIRGRILSEEGDNPTGKGDAPTRGGEPA